MDASLHDIWEEIKEEPACLLRSQPVELLVEYPAQV